MKKELFIEIAIALLMLVMFSCGRHIIPAKSNNSETTSMDSANFDFEFVEALKQKILGNAGEALRLLEICLKINPESDAVNFQISQILIGTGDINNGKKFALKALSQDQKNFWYNIMVAGTYYREQNLDSAAIFYEKAVRNFPEREDLLLTLGKVYSENKKYEKANEIFESIDRKYGINESSTVEAVKNLMAAEKYHEAEEKDRELMARYPDEILYMGLLAEIYSGEGKTDKAMEVYDELLKKNPDNADTQLSLASFLIEKKQYDTLLSFLGKILVNANITKDDKVKLFTLILGTNDLIETKGNELMLDCMVLESVYKNDKEVEMLRPQILIEQKMLPEAAKRLEEIIEISPENYYAWEKVLLIYLELKDYNKLQEKGELCATKFNTSFLAKILYATAVTENKHYDIALKELGKAEILAGNNKDMMLQVLSLRADVYYRMKSYKEAFQTFDEALKNDSRDLTVLNNYAYYLAEQNLRLKDAEGMAKEVIEKDKTNETFLDTYSWVLYKRGKINEAAKVMEEILKNKNEKDPDYYIHYGYILKKKKDCNGAAKSWETAYKLDTTRKELLKEIENCRDIH